MLCALTALAALIISIASAVILWTLDQPIAAAAILASGVLSFAVIYTLGQILEALNTIERNTRPQ